MKVIHFIRINRIIHFASFLSASLFVILSALAIAPVSFHQELTEAATGTSKESVITLDIAKSSAGVDLTVNNSNGNFATSTTDTEASFSVTTNNYTGYTLSISAADNNGELVNNYSPGESDSLSSIPSSADKVLTDSTFDNATYNGNWGYKPSKYRSGNTTVDNTGDDAVYLASPTTSATTLDVTNTSNNEANSYTIGLGARADYAKPAGTYTKAFTLTAVGNPINYSVTYNKNTTDTVTNMPYSSTNNIQAGDTSSTTITLSNLVPAREHYSFLGWCSGTVTTTNGVDSCSTGANIYNPNGGGTNLVYGIDQTTLNNTTIYAMWKIDTFTCAKQYKLQNVDGTYPSAYTADTEEEINYGSTCTYTKTITDYQGDTGNDTARSVSQTITDNTTLSLEFPRNIYALTITKNNAFIESVTDSGNYRWGQTVAIVAVENAGGLFRTWVQTAGAAGTFGSATSASTTFTMGKGDTTIYADGYCNPLPSGTGVMQTYSIDPDVLAKVCVNATTTLTDNRDNNQYIIAKLADGKLWTLDNLRLDLTDSTIRNSLTSLNTNADSTSLTSLNNGNRSAGSQYAISGFEVWSSDNIWDVYNKPKANAEYKDVVSPVAYGSGSGKSGVFYNLCAASAGSYCYDQADGTGDVSNDICPKKWRIPTGGSSGEYQALVTAITGSTSSRITGTDADTFNNDFSTALSGNYYYGALYDAGNISSVWSTAGYNNEFVYTANMIPSGADVSYTNDRSYGRAVRCIFGS